MFTDFGPVLLIPSAWAVTAATHAVLIGSTPVRMMHLAMTVFLLIFTLKSRGKMQGDVLSAWRNVILAGTLVTLLATVNLFYEFSGVVSHLEIFYWMAAPAYGFYVTSRSVKQKFYVAAAALTAVAAIIFSYSVLTGEGFVIGALALATVSQTAGIVEAAFVENLRKND